MSLCDNRFKAEVYQEVATLVDLLGYRTLHQPEKIAFTFLENGETPADSITYQELDRQARAIAAQLQSLVATGSRALLLYPSGLEFITAFFGCLYAGVVAVPAYPLRRNQKMSRLQAIVADADITVALTKKELLANIESRFAETPELPSLCWLATDNIGSEKASVWQKPLMSKDTLAFLQYTSGSTGKPKGVMVSHGNLLHNSQYIKQAFELTADSVSVSWLPSFHDMGLIDGIIQPLYIGFLGVLMAPASFVQSPIRWLQAISRYRATHCGGPNFAYELCVSNITPEQRDTLNLSSWCSAYSGAEPVRKDTFERFAAAFKSCGFQSRSFYPCYGMAETTLMVSGGNVKDEPVYHTVAADELEKNRVVQVSSDTHNVRHLVGCGRSWLDTKIAIVDPELLTQCAPNQVGEIWVSGSSVAQGYWNRPELTEQIFRAQLQGNNSEAFLRTGDLGFLQGDELFITGRLKDLIIIRGRNHYPQDIEFTVEQCHPALRPNCGAAFSVEVNGQEKLVIAQEVERSHLRKLNANEVIETIRQVVAQEHEVEVYAIALLKTASIPKTSSGKIQRSACKFCFINGTLDIVENWTKELQQFTETVEENSRFLQQLEVMPIGERRAFLTAYVCSQVAKVLRLNSSTSINSKQGFFDLGMDSLISVELRNRLQTSLECSLPSTLSFDYPTVEVLVDYLSREIIPLDFDLKSTAELENNDTDLAKDWEKLSDSEAEELLITKLESIRY
ncbi:MAG: AMP-binding protein [Scytonematopsis contorta HA4267-MV1]|jgi:acyl-CoA synthetase (AMP-forming)/AMP-acid ligase II/acyl carrier protein|nr:AMP-binding protein [Scytonematopsis contorta HA4267-MV1]